MLSISDELYTVLGEAGYTGTANDRVYKWLQDTVGRTDLSINDMAMLLFKRIGYTGSISDIVNSKVPAPLTLLAQGLFINGEQGALYDLYDQSTLFQDAAGTTPWTTLGQPLGLQLDKSKGLALGPERVPSLNFQSGWGTSNATVSSASAFVVSPAPGGVYTSSGIFDTGRNFSITVSFTASGSTTLELRNGTTGASPLISSATGASGTITAILVSAASVHLYFRSTAAVTVTVTSISVRELPGNHRYQTTSASRPTIEARVNRCTKSEFPGGITDAPTRGGLITGASLPNWLGRFTTGISFGHDGSTTSYVYMGNALASAQHTISVFVKMDDGNAPSFGNATASNVANDFVLIVSSSAVSPLTYAVTSVGDGVYRVSATITSNTTSLGNNGVGKYNTNSSRTFKVTGYQLELGSVATTYQSVNTATDYADIGAPRRIKYDGIDDFLQTASVDFSATDKMTVWAGVRKLSDAAIGFIAELSANAATNTGAFYLIAPGTAGAASYGFNSRGTASAQVLQAGYVSPHTAVLTCKGEISTDTSIIRVNRAESSVATDQGSGNYGTYPIYFGARAGTSLRFSGEVFSPEVIRGAESTAAQIDMVERVINRNAGGIY